MEHSEDSFKNKFGLKIYYQSWVPNEPKAVVQIAHGIWEHSGRFKNVVDKLVPHNYSIYINDHQGHGKSEGKRTHIDSFNDFVDDCYEFTKIIKTKNPNLPIFFLGLSMGSFLGQIYAINHQKEINGIILTGSGTTGAGVNPITLFIAKILSKVLPKMMLPSGHDANILSNDPEVVKKYLEDPLIDNSKGSARIGKLHFTFYKKIKDEIRKLTLPILLQKGGKDVGVVGFSELVDDIRTKDKTVKVYKESKHEVYNEVPEIREVALTDLLDWLEERVK